MTARAVAMARGVGILAGYVADRMFGDPQRGHPVAVFGSVAQRVEGRMYADSRPAGVAYTALLVGGVAVGGAVVERLAVHPVARAVVTAAATWTVLGGRSLEREAAAVHAHLAADDLPAARVQVSRLVGRDTEHLDAGEVSRAVVESVAENTVDAVVSPLVWGAACGVPGLLGYRAINTLDAMVGHHNARYERFGWASARLDDVANLAGARLAGVLTLVAEPRGAAGAWRAWRRDAAGHPSPNAGVVEAAFAGSLGIRLGGTNRYYGTRVEHRAVMGDGRGAEPADVVAANRLARRIGAGSAVVSAVVATVLPVVVATRLGELIARRGQNGA
ncbi:cobalamin biosynthesis protein [Kribbia dieselivorans]|uniref:cobalamin biosynthesis protein n=1 Tax=Kribbia dieselivorans TaxID=331526 RepID=UPI0009F9C8EA|nr:cobalamin biosynthesis protein [Kribbia dieselivorans]